MIHIYIYMDIYIYDIYIYHKYTHIYILMIDIFMDHPFPLQILHTPNQGTSLLPVLFFK